MNGHRDPHDLHWGESRRNASERMGGKRNASALGAFIAEAGVISHTFFIQTCGHTARRQDGAKWVSDVCPHGVKNNCRTVTAVFYGRTEADQEDTALKNVRGIANKLNVPLYVIEHTPYDYDFEREVTIKRYSYNHRVSIAGDTWDKVCDILRGEQFRHEDAVAANSEGKRFIPAHAHPKCNSRRVGWLGSPVAPRAREEDLTLSMIVREIPGVRHIDIDSAIFCGDCGRSYCMIEATSDGVGPRRGVPKVSFMTRNVASSSGVETMLIQHGIDDHNLEYSIRMSVFDKTGDLKYEDSGDWDIAFAVLENIQKSHQKFCPARRRKEKK